MQEFQNQITFLKSVGTQAKEKTNFKSSLILLYLSHPIHHQVLVAQLPKYIPHTYTFFWYSALPCNLSYHHCSHNLLNEEKK